MSQTASWKCNNNKVRNIEVIQDWYVFERQKWLESLYGLIFAGIWTPNLGIQSVFQMVKKRSVCKWSRFWMGSKIQKPNHCNPGKWLNFFKNHLKSGQKCWDFERSGFRMVGTKVIAIARPFETGPFEIQPSKSPDFKSFLILDGHISDPRYIPI